MDAIDPKDAPAHGGVVTSAPACALVIFGGNGDLAKRLQMPALYNLAGAGLLDEGLYAAGHMQNSEVPAYIDEKDVPPDSRTEIFVAIKLMIDNWRWANVPFYLRTGKRMSTRKTEISINFKQAPVALFGETPAPKRKPNVMVLHLQPPHEGISLHFSAKQPGQTIRLDTVRMDFRYEDFFELKPATGYETLINDVLIGDQTLFNRADNIEVGWKGVQPILDAIDRADQQVHSYPAGSDGPAAADALLSRDGRQWQRLA
jgi:glucose-6-phosphate 1-dehydrogenase